MKGRVVAFDAGSGWHNSERLTIEKEEEEEEGGREGGKLTDENQKRLMTSTGPAAVGYVYMMHSAQHNRIAN